MIPVLTIFSHRALDQSRQVRTTGDAFIVMEVQLRNAAQLHFTGQLHAQKTRSSVEHLD
jgi:hypothetical protein